MSLEESMMYGSETMIPVYFAPWHSELQIILDDIAGGFITDEKAGSAAEAIYNSISASGYQVVVTTGQALPKTEVKVATLHGKLTGTGTEEKLPTIAIVTYYDSTGVAPVSEMSLTILFLISFMIFVRLYMLSIWCCCRNCHSVRTVMLPV